MNNPFDYTPDEDCAEAYRSLTARIEILRRSDQPEDVNFCRELDAGKMLGVLIAADDNGLKHTLYAFSGQLGEGGFHHPGFVEPVFDYLRPDGYFKTKERDISRQNEEIAQFKAGCLAAAKEEYERIKERLEAEVTKYREQCRKSKTEREAKRARGLTDEAEMAAMIRQSQFEKAELRRLRKRAEATLAPFATKVQEAESYLSVLKKRRRHDSEALQNWLFSNFQVLNAHGESKSLIDIFAETSLKIPPSGAGECCAPKLLQAAYRRGLHPISIAEYWYGKPRGGEVRIHGEHYPACRGKCLPVLSRMLQGLTVIPSLDSELCSTLTAEPEIIFENEWFCVVNKPSGMLSVPGKGVAVSVQQWLTQRYGPGKEVKAAHRLDQDTSGLIIAAFGSLPFKVLQSLFATRQVRKSYVAVLDGDYQSQGLNRQGCITLPLSPDVLDRPRQRIDSRNGKEAVTDYEFVSVCAGRSRVIFHPHTGRTHQLRVHAASPEGLAMPIAGDRLYGKNGGKGAARLLLHAHKIEFTFPIDGQRYCFECEVPF